MKKILYIFSLIFLSSCGFYSFTGASISPDVKTFSVKYFPNKAATINASLSSVFTEKLKEQMDSLAKNLSSLNGVYGGMLSAMSNK